MEDSQMSVEAMIEAARKDPKTLNELLGRFRDDLRAQAENQLETDVRVRCSASDIVQLTLYEAWNSFGRFRGDTEAAFRAWLAQINTQNLCDAFRRNVVAEKRSVGGEQRLRTGTESTSFVWHPEGPGPTPSAELIDGERAKRLAEALELLPEFQREAVRLRHLEGMSLEEIAERLDRSVVATAGLIKRGLKSLRKTMSKDSWF
jgi:RNA polymerase sigma-70 factor (ECF subfamily)